MTKFCMPTIYNLGLLDNLTLFTCFFCVAFGLVLNSSMGWAFVITELPSTDVGLKKHTMKPNRFFFRVLFPFPVRKSYIYLVIFGQRQANNM